MKTQLTCPNRGHLVTVELHNEPSDGHVVGIERCSAFRPEDWVDCDQECARRLNQRLERRK